MKQLFVSRVLRDVSDGVMVLNPDGTVAFLNPSGLRLLGIPEEFQNRKYAALMEASSSPDNDDFHQLILDSIYDKDRVHRKEVSYTQPGEPGCICRSGPPSCMRMTDIQHRRALLSSLPM